MLQRFVRAVIAITIVLVPTAEDFFPERQVSAQAPGNPQLPPLVLPNTHSALARMGISSVLRLKRDEGRLTTS
jgi:hypothetical protein